MESAALVAGGGYCHTASGSMILTRKGKNVTACVQLEIETEPCIRVRFPRNGLAGRCGERANGSGEPTGEGLALDGTLKAEDVTSPRRSRVFRRPLSRRHVPMYPS